MNLTTPTALLWAGLAVPLVLLYVLKVRLRRVPVSTALFWRQVFEEKSPRSLWRRLRHLLSLLVQLAFLALLVLALAEPFFSREARDARQLVLVVDTSASMGAADGGATRLEQARDEARRLVEGMSSRDEAAIVTAGGRPRVLCGLTDHRGTLRRALDAVAGGDEPTRVSDAVALARRLLAGRPNPRVVVLSDGCFEGAGGLSGDDLSRVVVGTRADNVGITRFQARRTLLDPTGYEVLAEVVNFSDGPTEFRFELTLDGRPEDVIPVKLPAGGRWREVFDATSVEGGRLVGRVDRPDALAADNEARALLPRREPLPMLLVAAGSPYADRFVEKVLEASPLVRLSVTAAPPRAVPPGTITVFHRKVPARLPPGPTLVIDPRGPCELWDVGDKLPGPVVVKQEGDSPLLTLVQLDRVLMPEARKLIPKAPAKVPASSLAGDPLCCAFERPGGRVLVLTVNLEQGDLPLRTAFPILASNALTWLAGTKDELREALPAGAVAEVELPGRAPESPGSPLPELWLWSPDGRGRKLPARGDRATVGPLDRCGVWAIARRAPGGEGPESPPLLEVACNLADPAESDLRPREGFASDGEDTAAGVGGRAVSFYLLAAAWLLAGLEWYLYQRRWIS